MVPTPAVMAVASGMCLLDSATAFVQLVPPAISWQGHAGTKNNVIPQACNSPARQQPRSTRAAMVSMAVAEGAAAADDGGASLPRVLWYVRVLYVCAFHLQGEKEARDSTCW